MKKLSVLLFITLSITSCGKKEEESNSKAVQLSYELSSNNCSTGKHVFFGKTNNEARLKYCNSLKDSEVNKNCASTLRRISYNEECKGVEFIGYKNSLCFNIVKKNIVPSEYDTQKETEEIQKECKFEEVFHQACIDQITKLVHEGERNTRESMYKVLEMCRVWNKKVTKCFDDTVKSVHPSEYDEIDEVARILDTCRY